MARLFFKNTGTAKCWKRDVMRRELLAHMLQGLESLAVYEFACSHPGLICALEHDGFISYRLINESDWQHPFLKIVLKHSCGV